MIDLHSHSCYSDGVLTPKELVEKALFNQVKCLSLTDHDTLAGLNEVHHAALNTPLQIINGIELSTRFKKNDIHILGLNIQSKEALQTIIERQTESRIQRAREIGALLEKGDVVQDAFNKAQALAGHARVGRVHFAKVLMNEGKVRDMQMAFKQYLSRGRQAYVATAWISVAEAVEAIVNAGGQASIAHPLKYGLTRSKLHALIEEFKEAGGVGIEVVSGQMTTIQIKEAAGLSLRFKLLASSGSDYHGDLVSYVSLGKQALLPDFCTPIWHDWNLKGIL
jgi:predicted metal-dependent phosphoesterase TrpH